MVGLDQDKVASSVAIVIGHWTCSGIAIHLLIVLWKGALLLNTHSALLRYSIPFSSTYLGDETCKGAYLEPVLALELI